MELTYPRLYSVVVEGTPDPTQVRMYATFRSFGPDLVKDTTTNFLVAADADAIPSLIAKQTGVATAYTAEGFTVLAGDSQTEITTGP